MHERQLERSTLEAYGAIGITIFIYVIPMSWWMLALLVWILIVLAGDISFHAPWFQQWSRISKIILWVISIGILVVVSWKPIYVQYEKYHQPVGIADIQKFGQELIDLSFDILTFDADRVKQEPPRYAGKSPEDSAAAWAAGVQFRDETSALMQQRFGSRILSDVAILKNMGVTIPRAVQSSMLISPSGMGKWLGAIGHLLAAGKLQDAITTGSDEQLWWGLVH